MKNPQPDSSRRFFLRKTGAYLSLLPASTLLGCASENPDDDARAEAAVDENTTDQGNSAESSTAGAELPNTDNSDIPWASGGTRSMSIDYPNPFDEGLGNVCEILTEATTEGPCYAATLAREDISEGRDGLPTRLCFKLVDSACNPIEGAVIDIWHCDTAGIYSGDSMRAVNFCTNGLSEYTSNDFFRGTQTTGADGVAWFSTCFPGWYTGRAVHIHFIVRIDERASVTSQVCFDDGLVDEILAKEPVYVSRGLPDTHNYDDSVFPSTSYEKFLMSSAKMSDGSMLAWKALMVN